jgi:hypothetical protein
MTPRLLRHPLPALACAIGLLLLSSGCRQRPAATEPAARVTSTPSEAAPPPARRASSRRRRLGSIRTRSFKTPPLVRATRSTPPLQPPAPTAAERTAARTHQLSQPVSTVPHHPPASAAARFRKAHLAALRRYCAGGPADPRCLNNRVNERVALAGTQTQLHP